VVLSGATFLVFLMVGGAVFVGLVLILSAMLAGGRAKPLSLRCIECNTPNRDDANFCARCGHKLDGAAPPRFKP